MGQSQGEASGGGGGGGTVNLHGCALRTVYTMSGGRPFHPSHPSGRYSLNAMQPPDSVFCARTRVRLSRRALRFSLHDVTLQPCRATLPVIIFRCDDFDISS